VQILSGFGWPQLLQPLFLTFICSSLTPFSVGNKLCVSGFSRRPIPVLFLHEGIVRAVQGWKTLAVSSLEQVTAETLVGAEVALTAPRPNGSTPPLR